LQRGGPEVEPAPTGLEAAEAEAVALCTPQLIRWPSPSATCKAPNVTLCTLCP
jgi:hypothetical protein